MSSLRLALKQSLEGGPKSKKKNNRHNANTFSQQQNLPSSQFPFGMSDKELRRMKKLEKAESKAKKAAARKREKELRKLAKKKLRREAALLKKSKMGTEIHDMGGIQDGGSASSSDLSSGELLYKYYK